MTHEEKLALAIQFNKERVANNKVGQIATRDLIRADALEVEELEMLVGLYPELEVGKTYKVGDIFQYSDKLFEVMQAHTSQADWLPTELPALYKALMPSGVIPNWIQPTGAQDAYQIGDKVLFETKVYESVINANTWSPTGYPAG